MFRKTQHQLKEQIDAPQVADLTTATKRSAYRGHVDTMFAEQKLQPVLSPVYEIKGDKIVVARYVDINKLINSAHVAVDTRRVDIFKNLESEVKV